MLRSVDVYRRIGTANWLHLRGPLTALPLILGSQAVPKRR